MKRLALVAAVFALAACAKKDDAPAADTSAAMAPAPAVTDTGMAMSASTTPMGSQDTITKKDSVKKPKK